MLDFGYYNMDCMEGMKAFPDKYFDLAIVDPPYGDGGGTWTNGERFGQRFDRYRKPSPTEAVPNIRGGWQTPHKRTAKGTASSGLVELGRRSSEKNYFVGRRAGTGIL